MHRFIKPFRHALAFAVIMCTVAPSYAAEPFPLGVYPNVVQRERMGIDPVRVMQMPGVDKALQAIAGEDGILFTPGEKLAALIWAFNKSFDGSVVTIGENSFDLLDPKQASDFLSRHPAHGRGLINTLKQVAPKSKPLADTLRILSDRNRQNRLDDSRRGWPF